MPATPWELTDEMFLDEEETASLCLYLRERINSADEASRSAAVVDRIVIETLLFSGLRNSEFCRLRVADTIVGLAESALRVEGTRQQDRMVYVPSELSDSIRDYVKRVRPFCLPEGMNPRDQSQPLILNERGNPYDRTALYRRVVRILSGANLEERASVQLLRHSYGYLAYKRTGGNLLFVQQQLGHAHPMVTAVYAQFVEHPPRDLAELVGGPTRVMATRPVDSVSIQSNKQKGRTK